MNKYKYGSVSLKHSDLNIIRRLSGTLSPGNQLSNAQVIKYGLLALSDQLSRKFLKGDNNDNNTDK